MELDGLLSALEERANTARTIFMLLDSDADGLVAVEQVQRRPSESRHSRQTVQAHRGCLARGRAPSTRGIAPENMDLPPDRSPRPPRRHNPACVHSKSNLTYC